MAKIDRVEDLPEWFKLEAYRECKSFGAADWFGCLAARRDILRFANWLHTSEYSSHSFAELLHEKKECAKELAELRRAPLDWKAGKGWLWVGANYRRDLLAYPVRDLWMWDLALQFQYDRDGVSDGDEPPFQLERWRLMTCESTQIPAGLDLSVGHIVDTGIPIVVDLRATDSVLIAAFSAWLKAARAQQSDATSKRECPAYKDWSRYGLLPYLDLLIWAKETGNQIPHHVMAAAVGYRKGGDSFRKTVPKLADELMRSLAELEALAAVEATKEEPAY